MRRQKLPVRHERNDLVELEARAAELRLARDNVRFLWLGGAIDDAEAIRIAAQIDSRETRP